MINKPVTEGVAGLVWLGAGLAVLVIGGICGLAWLVMYLLEHLQWVG